MSNIVTISRVVSDLALSTDFYVEALGFSFVERRRCAPDLLTALGATSGGEQAELQLGEQLVTLVQFAQPAPSLRQRTQSNDLWFQHIAVVVSDIDRAYAHLRRVGRWVAITENGPQTLPPEDGGVRAFKFKGPDGHPFELIWFPAGQGRPIWQNRVGNQIFLGIDHTAISISSTSASVSFYSAFDFRVVHQTLNEGRKQSLLDALPGALVDVTSMRPTFGPSMGIELLRYHPHGRRLLGTRPENLINDWVAVAIPRDMQSETLRMYKDPDGHRVITCPI